MLKNQRLNPELSKVEQILNKYPSLSRRFIVTYAIACARDALSLIANPDPSHLAALTVTEAYLAGETTHAELVEAINAADAAASSYAATYYAAVSAARAYYDAASRAAYASSYAAAAAASSAAKAAGKHRGEGYYRDMLIDMINKLPLVERIILGVD